MKIFNPTTKKGKYIFDLETSKGSIKNYTYIMQEFIRLKTKQEVLDAINLELKICRIDKITKKAEWFNYNTYTFEIIKDDKILQSSQKEENTKGEFSSSNSISNKE